LSGVDDGSPILRVITVAMKIARVRAIDGGNAWVRLIRHRIEPMKSSDMPRLGKTIGVDRGVDVLWPMGPCVRALTAPVSRFYRAGSGKT
jgi:hypothetical protein